MAIPHVDILNGRPHWSRTWVRDACIELARRRVSQVGRPIKRILSKRHGKQSIFPQKCNRTNNSARQEDMLTTF